MKVELKEKLKKELADLYLHGVEILAAEIHNENIDVKINLNEESTKKIKRKSFVTNVEYQKWYSKVLPLIKKIAPDRFDDFRGQYKNDKKIKEKDFLSYSIEDYYLGLRVTRNNVPVVDPFQAFFAKFQYQLNILNSIGDRLDFLLLDIEGVIKTYILEDELYAAEDLLEKKHLRAAGALAGVTLEAHLSSVCENHGLKFRKKSPSISDYNEALKGEKIIDVPVWRKIQWLGDIRNLCVHSKSRTPKEDEVRDLLEGVKNVVSTLF